MSGEDPELQLVGVGMRLSQQEKPHKQKSFGGSGDGAVSDVERMESPSGDSSDGEQMAAQGLLQESGAHSDEDGIFNL